MYFTLHSCIYDPTQLKLPNSSGLLVTALRPVCHSLGFAGEDQAELADGPTAHAR
jgi:hypothetical protein